MKIMAQKTITSQPLPAMGVRWLLAGICVLFAGLRGASAETPSSKEYQVKAACLLNFFQYIEWPAAAFPQTSTPITIGVLGEDPFGDILERTFQDESVQGRALVVKRSRQVEDLKDCHVLFVSKSEKNQLGEILASLRGASTVSVGDMDEFAQRGGIINFYIDSGKIRFEINPTAAQPRGIKIGAQLLKRARIVGADPRKGNS